MLRRLLWIATPVEGPVRPGWHDEMLGDNRGLNPVSLFRLSQRLQRNGHARAARVVQGFSFLVFRTILPPAVEAGFGLELNHRGLNVVIHPLTTLGEHVRIQHGVTIANSSRLSDPDRRRTVIGDRVRIGVGAVIIGPLTIGERAVIGAGAVVTRDVPACETWAGNPARCLHGDVERHLVLAQGADAAS
jgi:serine O-acetyltransferase